MAGPPEELPIPQRLQAIRRQWELLVGGFDEDGEARRVAELEEAMGAPGFWDDQQSAAQVSAEHSRATRRLERWRALRSDVEDLEALAEMAEEDETVAEEVAGQMAAVEERLGELEEERLFSGRYDAGDALVTVNAGAGGTDAQDWAEMVLRMMMRWAERRGFKAELLEASPGEEAGIKSATFRVSGENAYGLFSAEKGVHRLVRLSPFDAAHRRQTSRSRRWSTTSATSRSRTTTCRSTPTAPPAPAASTSTRPTRRCASPTGRRGSSCSARTSARSRPTRTRR
jgi:peptide chain release factor 2